MRLVVLPLNIIYVFLNNSILFNLSFDEFHVALVVDLVVVVTHCLLSVKVFDVGIELVHLKFTDSLKFFDIIKMSIESHFCNCTVDLSSSLSLMHCMVIDSKWSLRFHEFWKSCMVVVTDLLSVESILDYFSLVFHI